MLTLARIEQARQLLLPWVRRSPVVRSQELSRRCGREIWLKLENQQVTGSFKERGAAVRLLRLSAEERARGVICASAGNHAQGVAYHAARLQIPATVVMPESTPLIKVQNTRSYGARVLLHGASFDEAQAHATALAQSEQLSFVHPFDDEDVMAGQGTLGLELLEQIPDLDTVVLAIGGGGLMAGVATAVKAFRADAKIIGVQMAQLDSMRQALAHGAPVTLPAAETLADGIAVRRAAERTLALAKRLLDELAVVDDEEVAAAILYLLEREKTVVEGAGAAPVAALLHDKAHALGQRVAVVISGGNIDVSRVSRIIERGLVKSQRLVQLSVAVPDVAGALAKLTHLIAEERANVVQIHHERAFLPARLASRVPRGAALVELVLETRGAEHTAQLHAAIAAAGYVLLADD